MNTGRKLEKYTENIALYQSLRVTRFFREDQTLRHSIILNINFFAQRKRISKLQI